jgi:hypothetical protein
MERHGPSSLQRLLGLCLALLLAVQTALAAFAAPPSRALPDGRVEIVLCSGSGFHTVLLNLETGEVETGTPIDDRRGDCPFCLVGPALTVDPPALPVLARRVVAQAFVLPEPQAPALRLGWAAAQIRAPPLLSV